MTKNIELNNLDFQKEISTILKKYNQECLEKVEEKSKEIGKKAVSTLKNTTNTYKVRTGEYNKSWSLNYDSQSLTFETTVFNKKHYRLTHLLEKGHATLNGGRTRAYIHIAPVQENANKELYYEVKKIYGGG